MVEFDIVKISSLCCSARMKAARRTPAKRPAGKRLRRPRRAASYHHGALREALLTAAADILLAAGVEGFTLRECARRAGVSHAAPAHHFGDVRGLLTELAAVGFEQLAERIRLYLSRAGADTAARLTAVGQAYIDFALARRAHFQLMFRQERLDPARARLQAASMSTYDAMTAELTRASSPEELISGGFETKIVLACSAVHGFATLLLAGAFERHAPGCSAAEFAARRGADMLRLMQAVLVTASKQPSRTQPELGALNAASVSPPRST